MEHAVALSNIAINPTQAILALGMVDGREEAS